MVELSIVINSLRVKFRNVHLILQVEVASDDVEFEGCIVFDECHRAKNLVPSGGGIICYHYVTPILHTYCYTCYYIHYMHITYTPLRIHQYIHITTHTLLTTLTTTFTLLRTDHHVHTTTHITYHVQFYIHVTTSFDVDVYRCKYQEWYSRGYVTTKFTWCTCHLQFCYWGHPTITYGLHEQVHT